MSVAQDRIWLLLLALEAVLRLRLSQPGLRCAVFLQKVASHFSFCAGQWPLHSFLCKPCLFLEVDMGLIDCIVLRPDRCQRETVLAQL